MTSVAIDVLRALPLEVEVEEHSFGGGAILAEGTPLPEATLAACRSADAVVLGAVGLPELEGAAVRPEQGLIELKAEFISVSETLALAAAYAVFKDGRKFWDAADATLNNVRADPVREE